MGWIPNKQNADTVKRTLARRTEHGNSRFGLIAEAALPYNYLVDAVCL
jgi:hypothetical protein